MVVVAEWLIATDCESVDASNGVSGGSNPLDHPKWKADIINGFAS